jgi:hypothetical protein
MAYPTRLSYTRRPDVAKKQAVPITRDEVHRLTASRYVAGGNKHGWVGIRVEHPNRVDKDVRTDSLEHIYQQLVR